MYSREIRIKTTETEGSLFITDDAEYALRLKAQGAAVLPYLHEGNRNQDFSAFLFGVEEPEDLEPDYLEKVYRRLQGLPWKILETERLRLRETTVGDVDAFWKIYEDPAITKYTEGLYPQIELERQYIREYIERVYSYYEYGVWTIVDKKSGSVIGRAGFSQRPGFEVPELGFVIGVPWQRKGYAYEICKAILDYGREQLDFTQVQAMVEPANEASLRLCDRLGFHPEDTDRREYIIDGKKHLRLLIGLN